ncbi:MAG: VanZ family protein [Pelovirga sp.]
MPRLTPVQTFLLLPPALLCAVLLFVGGPGPDSLRSVRHGWVSGHLVAFALWSYLYLSWRGSMSFRRLLTEIVVFCLLLGGLTEILQSLVGREPSWQDVYNDLLGGLVAVVFFAPQRRQLLTPVRLLLQLSIILALAWGLAPLSRALTDEMISRYQFPLLSGFETPFEGSRWGGKSRRYIDRERAYAGDRALRVELVAGWYPGVFLNYFPSDWREYAALQMAVHSPADGLSELHLRIHDQQHRLNDNVHRDRFTTNVLLEPGWNRVQVLLADVVGAPRERDLDLQRVAGVGLFAVFLEQSQVIHIDEVRLLRQQELSLDD